VLGYVGADIAEAACVRTPMTRNAVGPGGMVTGPEVRERLADALQALARHAGAAARSAD